MGDIFNIQLDTYTLMSYNINAVENTYKIGREYEFFRNKDNRYR